MMQIPRVGIPTLANSPRQTADYRAAQRVAEMKQTAAPEPSPANEAPTVEQQLPPRPPLQFVPRRERGGNRFWLWLAGALAVTALIAFVLSEAEKAEAEEKRRTRETRAGGTVRRRERPSRRGDDEYDDYDDEEGEEGEEEEEQRPRRNRPIRERASSRRGTETPAIHVHMPQGTNQQPPAASGGGGAA